MRKTKRVMFDFAPLRRAAREAIDSAMGEDERELDMSALQALAKDSVDATSLPSIIDRLKSWAREQAFETVGKRPLCFGVLAPAYFF